jgi:hypothetical protein
MATVTGSLVFVHERDLSRVSLVMQAHEDTPIEVVRAVSAALGEIGASVGPGFATLHGHKPSSSSCPASCPQNQTRDGEST